MKRREVLAAGTAASLWPALGALPSAAIAQVATPKKTFRWAFNAAETGFDPAQISDLYSNYVVANIFEAPLQYDFLARPTEMRPRTAAQMPEISADFKRIVVRIRPGIYFQDDAAFKGQRRELTAEDYVYQLKRVADPRWKSPSWPTVETAKLTGLAELRKATQANGKFDYDRPIRGIRTLEKFVFEINLDEPNPRFYENLTDARVFGAVAREVVEFYGDQIMGHPVGTGAFRLVAWQRSSKIVLERNPDFREELYDARPASDDKIGQAIFTKLKGRKLPMIDRVELAIIEESQPRWLAFLNGEQDTVNIPLEFINVGAPNGKVAPALAKRGIELDRTISPDVAATLFNMDHPSIGGYSPDRVALRRAISLGYNTEEEIRLIRRGAMMLAQSHVPPLTQGYDPNFVSEMSQFSRVRATALLDTYGYVDRDGDGWRETPEGKPLVLDIATQSSQLDRAFNEMWKRQMDGLGIRVNFSVNQWPQNMKNARAGNLMVWTLGWTAGGSDPDAFLALASSHSIGASNVARFKLAEYDQLYQRQQQMSDGPERNEIIHQMKRLFVTYMPYKIHGHRFNNDMTHRRLIGYRRHPFARDFFKWIDVEA